MSEEESLRIVRYEEVKAKPNIDPDDPKNKARKKGIAKAGGDVVKAGSQGCTNVELRRRKVDKRMIGAPMDFR